MYHFYLQCNQFHVVGLFSKNRCMQKKYNNIGLYSNNIMNLAKKSIKSVFLFQIKHLKIPKFRHSRSHQSQPNSPRI